MAEYRGERFGQIAEEKSTKGLISWNIISLEKLIKKYRENFISIHLSFHSRFFLYFIRYHFLRVWTFRIASCHLFNFYQIYWISSLTRPEISPLKKKKNMSSIIFEQLSTSIHIHISYSNIFPTLPLNHPPSIQSCQIFHNIFANALVKIRVLEFSGIQPRSCQRFHW